ncbi:g2117 [Coccomyxa viridis]|uniref:G2117 protein n=1 Tax=Coccomyxa viridis TaxID=1274662 RepID=A0ABP1FLT8_9CHLO
MRPVVVILVGVPGAGKSTFSTALQAASPGRWERVNQDTVAGPGRKGSRPLCVAAARAALQAGHGAIIDRCNWDGPQRKDFIALAKQLHCEAHAIVLDLPTQLCANRAAARVDHEGGLDGPGAKSAVYRLGSQLAKAGRPQPSEGLSSVMVCNSEADVKRALQAWSEYRTSGKQPIEQYQRSTPAKRTLATLWGKHGSRAAAGDAGGAGQTNGSQGRSPTVDHGSGSTEPLHNSSAVAEKGLGRPGTGRQEADSGNAFAVLMNRAKQPAAAPPAKAPGHSNARRQQYQPNSWKDALRQVAVDPDGHRTKYPEMIVSEECILIHDAFPKAAHHALVLPREPTLHDVRSLNRAHIPLLTRMKVMAENWMASIETSEGFQMGFHSVPSMDHLHMHVISKDFNSPKLKTKQHWNSFTTAFFIPLEQVLLDLEAKDPVAVDPVQAEALLKQPLRCHKCQAAMRNMPDLKSHVVACTVRAAPHRAASAL